jgi:hypothetical protein
LESSSSKILSFLKNTDETKYKRKDMQMDRIFIKKLK